MRKPHLNTGALLVAAALAGSLWSVLAQKASYTGGKFIIPSERERSA
jgi:hypothetical protein